MEVRAEMEAVGRIEMKSLVWKVFVMKNQERISEMSPRRVFLPPTTITQLFRIYKEISTTQEVKYLSISLLEAFLHQRCEKAYENVPENKDKELQCCKMKALQWAMACLSISLKLYSQHSFTHLHVLRDVLHEMMPFKKEVSWKDLHSAELEVMEVLRCDFHHVTPLDYISLLVLCLADRIPHLVANRLAESSINVLEAIYPYRNAVYIHLLTLLKQEPVSEKDISILSSDYIFFAGSLIVAGHILLSGTRCCWEKLLSETANFIKIDSSFISMFTYVILDEIYAQTFLKNDQKSNA